MLLQYIWPYLIQEWGEVQAKWLAYCRLQKDGLLFLHQLTVQSSLFQPERPLIFTHSTSERADATMKGPLEKGELFTVLEYMKGGQVVTHPCAPLQRTESFIRRPSPSRKPSTPPSPSPFADGFPSSQPFLGFSCFIACANMGVNLRFHVPNTFLCLHIFGNAGRG